MVRSVGILPPLLVTALFLLARTPVDLLFILSVALGRDCRNDRLRPGFLFHLHQELLLLAEHAVQERHTF